MELKGELSEGIKNFEAFIKEYGNKKYKGTQYQNFRNFSSMCSYVSKDQIFSQTIANFVNEGAKLLGSNRFEKNYSNTFKQIAKRIGQLIVNGKIKLDSFKPRELANTFNGLAKCGVNLGEYLNGLSLEDKNAFIGALVDIIKDLLAEFNSMDIANTFNGLAQCGVNLGEYVNNDFIGALVGKIQKTLLEETHSQKQFNSIDIANTFNGLAKCGVNLGGYLNGLSPKDKNAFIRALVNRIQTLLLASDFNSQELANTFNGLAKCGVNLGGYLNGLSPKDKNAFIRALVGRIQTLLEETVSQKQFKPQELANTFNGLAQCGVNLGEDKKLKDEFIRVLVKKIQTLLSEFISIDIANTFNGLAKCGVDLGEYLNKLENKELKNAFIGDLVRRIQNLLKEKGPKKQFNSIDIANTFNGLAQCGVNLGEDKKLKDEFIRALVGRIQDLLKETTDSQKQFNSQALANTFNGLAKCGVDLGEYFKTKEDKKIKDGFIRALVNRIQTLLEKTDSQKQFTSQHIANTFNGLAQCGVNLSEYVNDKFIKALVNRIQILLSASDFNSQALANTFNGLAKCGVNLGEYLNKSEENKELKNAFIGVLVKKIQTLLSGFISIDIANTFNGLAKCGVDLGEYFKTKEDKKLKDAFIGALVDRIQALLEKTDSQKPFTSQHIANTFNGLAQCGVDLGEYFETEEGEKIKDGFIGVLVGRIQDLLKETTDSQKQFNSQELANTFNGLVKLFLYNEVLYRKNIKQFKDIINNLVQKYFKLSNRDNQNDWTVLYNIKYLQVCGLKFNEKILPEILDLEPSALNDDHTNSTLERKFGTFLSKIPELNGCYKQESKLTFQVGSASFRRSTDFYIEFTYEGKKYKTYIELDGPSHFTDIGQTQKTPKTQIRDVLTSHQLKEEQEELLGTQILYITLSANEFNEKIANFDMSGNLTELKIKTKEQLFKFLIQQKQLQQTTERKSDSSKLADKCNYTTPTQKSGVSELVEKAQQKQQSQEAQQGQQKQQSEKEQPIQFNLNAPSFVPRQQFNLNAESFVPTKRTKREK